MATFKTIGAGWRRPGNDGDFISVKLNMKDGSSLNLNLFNNKFKKKDNQPDFTVSMNEQEAVNAGFQTDTGSSNKSEKRVYKQARGNSYVKKETHVEAPSAAASGSGEPF